eukprot:gnl/Spiro4/3107_TR1508_c0_g1_i1.p1 gnl/Spiro4/3107_TR1508_c0_g1~~gnl/Spiro4/3107_TR1508_c0_g1_i1.p1  ORF type:complete len:313 (+),score=52.11 gnl/Spiro4/3107_TR1508_c0_g1_i1:73-1011(+)
MSVAIGRISRCSDTSGSRSLRIVCLSDTHNRTEGLAIPSGDVLVHTGDFSNYGNPAEVASFNEFIRSQPHAVTIFICGNHERGLSPANVADIKERIPNALYLQDDAVLVSRNADGQCVAHLSTLEELAARCATAESDAVAIYGAPWCNLEFQGFYLSSRAEKWGLIPRSTDILLTHMPEWGTLDLASGVDSEGYSLERTGAPPPPPTEWNVPAPVLSDNRRLNMMDAIRARRVVVDPTAEPCATCGGTVHQNRSHWGCRELRDALSVWRPRVHVFGHVHECGGQFVEKADGCFQINAAVAENRLVPFFDYYY